jgi:DNA-binding MarR family transcriptional regulator
MHIEDSTVVDTLVLTLLAKDRLSDVIKDTGEISLSQYSFLQTLAITNVPVSSHRIARELNLTDGAISQMAASLIARGYIERQPSGIDGRSVEYLLAAAGRYCYSQVNAAMREHIRLRHKNIDYTIFNLTLRETMSFFKTSQSLSTKYNRISFEDSYARCISVSSKVIKNAAARYGLSAWSLVALAYCDYKPSLLTVKTLSRMILLPSNKVVQIIAPLEKKGLIRLTVGIDRRMREINVTEEGKGIAAGFRELFGEYIKNQKTLLKTDERTLVLGNSQPFLRELRELA